MKRRFEKIKELECLLYASFRLAAPIGIEPTPPA